MHVFSSIEPGLRKMRGVLSIGLLSVIGMAVAPSADAQTWPDHPIKIVNTFPAGGSGDAVLRLVMDRVGLALGQPFVIETRTGAAGAIGANFVARSAPDGYTLVLGTASTFGTNSATQKNLAYDPIADFTPIIDMGTTPYFLLVNPSVPATTLPEFVAYAKAEKGKLNYGSFGLGSSNHLAYELLKDATNIDIVHVPYRGGSALITGLLGGEVQSSMDVYTTSIAHITSGRFHVLGVASPHRFPLLPDVPTLAEQGYPVNGGTFFALLGPAKLPPQIVATLNREVNKVLQVPEVRERLLSLGVDPVGGTPGALETTITEEIDKWSRLVKARDLHFD